MSAPKLEIKDGPLVLAVYRDGRMLGLMLDTPSGWATHELGAAVAVHPDALKAAAMTWEGTE